MGGEPRRRAARGGDEPQIAAVAENDPVVVNVRESQQFRLRWERVPDCGQQEQSREHTQGQRQDLFSEWHLIPRPTELIKNELEPGRASGYGERLWRAATASGCRIVAVRCPGRLVPPARYRLS